MKLGRAGRILAAGAVAAASWAMAEELGRSKTVRTSSLLALVMASGVMLVKNTAATKDLQNRLNDHVQAAAPAINLVANGGTIGGTVFVSGDHHISGSLYGSAGTLTVGDNVATPMALTASGTITGHSDINATSGNITGGTITSNADVQATSGTVHAGGLSASGAVHGGSTTGASNQSTLSALGDSNQGAASGPTLAEVNACINRVNDILNYLQGGQISSHNATITRVNDLLTALG